LFHAARIISFVPFTVHRNRTVCAVVSTDVESMTQTEDRLMALLDDEAAR